MPGNFIPKSSPERLIPISKIILLVHPLYSMGKTVLARKGVDRTLYEENARYLLSLWLRQMRRAAKNPRAVVVIVSPLRDLLNSFDASTKRMLDRFLHESEAVLGNRLFVHDVHADPVSLRREMVGRGFRLDRKWEGRAFGEYFRQCVHVEAAKFNLPRYLWKFAQGSPYWVKSAQRGKPMRVIPSLSVESQLPLASDALHELAPGKSLGRMHQRLRPVKKKK